MSNNVFITDGSDCKIEGDNAVIAGDVIIRRPEEDEVIFTFKSHVVGVDFDDAGVLFGLPGNQDV